LTAGLDRVPGIGITSHAQSHIKTYEAEYLASVIFFCLNGGDIHAAG
jgi:hypothetical protein